MQAQRPTARVRAHPGAPVVDGCDGPGVHLGAPRESAGWRLQRLVAGLCVVGSVTLAHPILALAEGLGDAVERTVAGEINWSTGWVRATGVGVPSPNTPPGQARALAQRAAYAVAVRNLLETVKGVRVDSETVVDSYLIKSDVIKTQVSGFVRGAQIDKTEVQPDGSVEILVKMPLWGADSLVTVFLGEKGVRSHDLPPDTGTGEGYSGLVIDARGLGVKPACFPSILDEKGTVLYGTETVDRAAAEKSGLAEYHTLSKDANLSTIFGERAYIIRPVQITPVPREGRRPLKIKGINKAGSLKANILISADDARKIQEDAQIGRALKRSRVVIVTDPLIGGIEGRQPKSNDQMTAAVVGSPL